MPAAATVRWPRLADLTPAQQAICRAMLEDKLKAEVLGRRERYGILMAHFRPALTKNGYRTAVEGDGKGWLDITAVGTRLLVRELKTESGSTTPEQRMWIAAWESAGVDVGIWKPHDLLSGRVDAELAAIATRRVGPHAAGAGRG